MHKLRGLRESAGLNQTEVSRHAHISQTRLSLAENNIGNLTRNEEDAIRQAILQLTAERSSAVARAADPGLTEALEQIRRSPSKLKLFETLLESRGFSELEAAIAVLGRNSAGSRSRGPTPNDRYGVE
jgi:transcriptional regulator with XRE-family HTH domain